MTINADQRPNHKTYINNLFISVYRCKYFIDTYLYISIHLLAELLFSFLWIMIGFLQKGFESYLMVPRPHFEFPLILRLHIFTVHVLVHEPGAFCNNTFFLPHYQLDCDQASIEQNVWYRKCWALSNLLTNYVEEENNYEFVYRKR